jgi:HAD superfamily hydrolase (TIGR01509 family)
MGDWPRAVLFDFDGVIVNSEPLHFYAFHEVLAAEKIELTEDEYYRDFIGFDDRGAFRHVFAQRGRPLPPGLLLSLIVNKSEIMMRLIEQRRFGALPGVEEFVRTLWRRCPLAICSGALREEIEAMLEGVKLRDCFPVIVAAEDVTVGKPDPSGYVLSAQLLSEKALKNRPPLKPADCLVVEDAPKVIESAKKAGFKTLGVATSYPMMKLADADWAVKSLRIEEVAAEMPKLKLLD